MNQDPVQQCTQLIHEANCIAALTGAGISTSAGIPDFRGPRGLYVTRQYDPETVFDIDYFFQDPNPFYEFARDFIELEQTIQPTIAHRFLSHLEQSGKLKGVVTQNIDALHQMAGSKNVLEMHGSFWKAYCTQCHHPFTYEDVKGKLVTQDIPRCSCDGVIKPDIVFFGENVKYLGESTDLARQADLFFVIGTSCVVQPAAIIPHYCSGKIVIVNMGDVMLGMGDVVLTVKDDIEAFFAQLAQELGFDCG